MKRNNNRGSVALVNRQVHRGGHAVVETHGGSNGQGSRRSQSSRIGQTRVLNNQSNQPVEVSTYYYGQQMGEYKI